MVRQSPRRRGRPIGDGIDDTAVLVAAARRILASAAAGRRLPPTTAMKLAGCKQDEASLRRLQRKWLERSASYLEAAKPERVPASVLRQPRETPSHAAATVTATATPTATGALERAYADLAMNGKFGTNRREETRVERELRVTSRRMDDLLMGRSSEDEIMRDAGCSNLARAFRETRLCIDRAMRTAIACGTADRAFHDAYAATQAHRSVPWTTPSTLERLHRG